MENLKTVRERLGVTQKALAEVLGCSQGNVSFYENGQTIPPHIAAKLIDFARSKGIPITFDDVYSQQAA